MTLPYHRVNVLTGTKAARVQDDPVTFSDLIKKARRPLLVVGPQNLILSLDGKLLLEYALEIAKAGNIAICATAHTKKKMLELGVTPDSEYDIIEIINHLKDKQWQGVKKEGNHDLVIFFGIRSDLATQGLSTLKHFAPHLKTMTLCKYVFPHAAYSLPNLKDDKWREFLEGLVSNLKGKEN
ncbi:CO dehydrogenase/acetyl-CoA synthase complex subunit epsilon [Chloroflexota bacterium]